MVVDSGHAANGPRSSWGNGFSCAFFMCLFFTPLDPRERFRDRVGEAKHSPTNSEKNVVGLRLA